MAAAAATVHELHVSSEIRYGDLVWTREGEAGRVAGFYRAGTPTVLVRLDSGDERQFLPETLLRVA